MPNAVIKLSAPIDTPFNGRVERLILKEPRAGMLFKLGQPRFWIWNPDGSGYPVEKDDAIRAYVNALLGVPDTDGLWSAVDGGGETLLDLMSLEDGIAVRNALFGFFMISPEAKSKTKPTPSSST